MVYTPTEQSRAERTGGCSREGCSSPTSENAMRARRGLLINQVSLIIRKRNRNRSRGRKKHYGISYMMI